MVLGVEGSRGMRVMVCGGLEGHCMSCVWGIVGSSVRLWLLMKQLWIRSLRLEVKLRCHLGAQTQEVTVVKAWSSALPVQRLSGCSQRLRGLIYETDGYWDASVSPKVGEWDACKADRCVLTSLWVDCSHSLGKALW